MRPPARPPDYLRPEHPPLGFGGRTSRVPEDPRGGSGFIFRDRCSSSKTPGLNPEIGGRLRKLGGGGGPSGTPPDFPSSAAPAHRAHHRMASLGGFCGVIPGWVNLLPHRCAVVRATQPKAVPALERRAPLDYRGPARNFYLRIRKGCRRWSPPTPRRPPGSGGDADKRSPRRCWVRVFHPHPTPGMGFQRGPG